MYALLWVLWTAGFMSGLRETAYFLMELINTVALGDQKKHTFGRTAAALALNLIAIFVIHTDPLRDPTTNFNVTNSVIIVASFLTSLGVFNWLLD